MRLVHESVSITTTGAAGAATGSATIPIPAGFSRLVALSIKYDTMPATTDVTLKSLGNGTIPERTVFTKANNSTDVGLTEVMERGVDASGAAITDGGWVHPLIVGRLEVGVAQADAHADAVIVNVVLELS